MNTKCKCNGSLVEQTSQGYKCIECGGYIECQLCGEPSTVHNFGMYLCP